MIRHLASSLFQVFVILLTELGPLAALVVVVMLVALSVGWLAGLAVVAFRMVAG